MIKTLLAGAIMLNAWAIGVFFWRFWRKTGDWLFWSFAAAFFLFGLERLSLVLWKGEGSAYVYLIRLCAFVMIAAGIVSKNTRKRQG